MQEADERIADVDALRSYVNHTLCQYDNLEVGSFSLSERPVWVAGRLGALHFCLHGPRMLRLMAIWDLAANRILFYGSRGERFLVTQLAESPAMAA
jgi:hypothetical protein